MWDLIISVPDHCLSFYFLSCEMVPWILKVGNTDGFDVLGYHLHVRVCDELYVIVNIE